MHLLLSLSFITFCMAVRASDQYGEATRFQEDSTSERRPDLLSLESALSHEGTPSASENDPFTYLTDLSGADYSTTFNLDDITIDADHHPWQQGLISDDQMYGSETWDEQLCFDVDRMLVPEASEDDLGLSGSANTTSAHANNGHDAGNIINWREHHKRYPPSQWQYKYRKDQIDTLFDNLTASWPNYVSQDSLMAQFTRINKWLNINPTIVAGLMDSDEATWEYALVFCKLSIERTKAPRKAAKKNERIKTFAWFAAPMLTSKKAFMVERLAEYWGFEKLKEVNPRVNRYVGKFGPITSPEPLLEGSDEETFRRAADAIYCKGAPYGHRNVGAGKDDLLHQISCSEIDSNAKVQRRIRVGAARYNSGESWLRSMSYEEVADIQDAIRDHWGSGVADRVALECLLLVNDFLETHPRYINRIKRGDQAAIKYVSRLTRSPPNYRAYKGGTAPAKWYIEPVEEAERKIIHVRQVLQILTTLDRCPIQMLVHENYKLSSLCVKPALVQDL